MIPLIIQAAFLLWRLGQTPEFRSGVHIISWAASQGFRNLVKRWQEKHGHAVTGVPTEAMLRELRAEYQTLHGLEPTGEADAPTLELLGRRRCGHPDVLASSTDLCKWPQRRVTYRQAIALKQIPPAKVREIYARAWQAWAEVCGVEPEETTGNGNVYAFNGDGLADGFDAGNTILALSYLPCNARPDTQLTQTFNDEIDWTEEEFLAVAVHEIGHALGLDHIQGPCVMNPYYQAGIDKPTPADVAAAVARYGPPKPRPTAPPDAPATPPVSTDPAPPDKSDTLTVELPIAQAGVYQLTFHVGWLRSL